MSAGSPEDPARDLDGQLGSAFSARLELEGDLAVVLVQGDVDLAARDEMWAVLEEALARGDRLAIDLANTTFLDSIGLNMIVRASNERGADLEPIILRSPSDAVLKLLRITGVERLVTIEPASPAAD